MDRLSGEPMAALCDLCHGVSKKTSDAVNRALALDYHARYKDMVSFLNDVDLSVLGGVKTDASKSSVIDRPPDEKLDGKRNITNMMSAGKFKKNAVGKGTICLIGFEGTQGK